MEHYDTIVLGGGSAGITAAIQAGRAGVRTLLVEKNGILGGTMIPGGVNYPGLFHAWGRQVVAGIGWDLVKRTVSLSGGELPDFTLPDQPHWKQQVRVDRALLAALADEAVLAAGVKPLFHTMVAQVQKIANTWNLTLCTKEGLQTFSCTVLVDCTGDANGSGLAGFERRMNPELQPGTLIFRLGGYRAEDVDIEAITRAAMKAIRAGDLLRTDFSYSQPMVENFLRNRGENAMHVPDIDGSTSAGRTQAEIKGRQALLRLYRFLRIQPGLEDLTIDYCAPEVGIRETWTIAGKKTICAEDYASGKMWDDAVCYSFYPIDIHRSDESGLDLRPLTPGTFPTIPRGAMLPSGSRNLIAAGRCISGDQAASSAFRTQATCMATGQAAGALAALAVKLDCDVEEVPLELLFELLAEHGAIVPGEVHVIIRINNVNYLIKNSISTKMIVKLMNTAAHTDRSLQEGGSIKSTVVYRTIKPTTNQ